MPLPPLTFATVLTQVPQRHRLTVLVDGAPMAGGIEVDVGTPGPRDGVRGTFGPLPTPGTRGLIAFGRGDLRNGVWVCSVSGALTDTNHGSPGAGAGDASHSAPSGMWHYRAATGQEAHVFPDGSFVLVGYTVPPTVTRHTLDANGQQGTQPFAQSQRVKTAPTSFPLTVKTAIGSSAVLAADGSVVVTSSGGASVTLAVDGSAVVHAAGGKTVTVSSGGTAQAVRLADGSASTVLRAQ